jgi:hypothetical protein
MGTAAGDYPPGHPGASGAGRDRALPGLSEAFHAGPIPAAESGQRSGQALPAAAVMPVASPFDRRVIWVGGIVFAVLMALTGRWTYESMRSPASGSRGGPACSPRGRGRRS